MLNLYYHEKDKPLVKCDDLTRISELIADHSITVWLDSTDPDRGEMDLLATEFGLHPLAIDDYFSAHRRPKVEVYPGYYFIVAHSPTFSPVTQEVGVSELDIFVGQNFLVTLHREPSEILTRIADCWLKDPKMLDDGAGMLLYDILDALIDSYFPVLDQIEDLLDDVEDNIFTQGSKESAESAFKLKRGLLVLWKMATPMRDMFNTLVRRDQPLFTDRTITYLRDIYDHVLRIVDSVDTYRDILTSAFDAYLSVISNRMNGVMKTLTAITTVLVSSQIISGIYGMNFKYMPGLGWRYGYPATIVLMIAIVVGLLFYFRKIKWL